MVFLSIPNVKTMSINVNPSATTICAFEQLVHQRTHLPQPLLRYSLCLRNPSLDSDSALLSDLGFGPLSTVLVHVPLIGGAAPPHYVAGLGRGATGFTTRSDIGPARADGDVEADVNHKFDDFEGNDAGLFANAECDDGDKEADAFWDAIDRKMDSGRKDRIEAKLKQEIENYRASNPKVSEQFVDLKRKLHTLSEDEWDSIPEIGNYSHRSKKKRFESFVPVPDTLLQEEGLVTALDPNSRAAGGSETPWTDLTSVGEGRGLMLSLKLDRLSDSLSGQTVVDPKGYLTDLKNKELTNDADIFHINRARPLLKSITQSNPKNPNGWIAAARLEERAGKIKAARTQIQKGCNECPKHEDVWVEACRLATPEDAKAVIAMGVKQISNSVKLWLEAAKLENNEDNKSRVLRKGLEHIPDSVRLWKTVVDMASKEDALVLLHRAVECCPLHPELWMALARLETYENTKKVLNRAREKLPKERGIWITAAKLEEDNGNTAKVGKIIEKGINALQREGVVIDREKWMEEAEVSERAGYVTTCQAIIKIIIGFEVDEEDRKRTWVADAEECKKRGSIETARAIYAHALTVFFTKKSIWLKAAQLEKSHGSMESLDAVLRKAVTYLPQAEVLWLMCAKEKWLAGDVPAARGILQEAHAAIPNSEEIWLAAFKLEFESREVERARMTLAKARERGTTGRVWMKSAIVERELGNVDEERRLLEEGVKKFPAFFKLWLMLGQLGERFRHLEQAKNAYTSGLKHCPECTPLWLSLADLEEKVNGLNKARAVLTLARKKNPKADKLWLAAVRAEIRHGNKREAERLMSKALQESPKSGILLAADIEMAGPCQLPQTKIDDALKKCVKKEEAHVTATVAKIFWKDRKVNKARLLFEQTVTLDPDNGDFWALYYKFELEHGSEEKQKEVLTKCVASEPKHGEKWQAISKALENAHQPVEVILKRVVIALRREERNKL
ncbi:PRP1 splicing factor N-terminal [Arabidopsis suecica]|uniref:PRP1 splicing factor N-terminal n=1 Tax=Arabidopsis suecica TaxID=45249 RepID=A0A8T1YED9_ARASU|nr:PRP1 splicing factor N-terminal [Arabidopsis suecica]